MRGPAFRAIWSRTGDYNKWSKAAARKLQANRRRSKLRPGNVRLHHAYSTYFFKWKTPVYVLADGVLGQMIEPFTYPEKAVVPKLTPLGSRWNPETRENLSPRSSSTSTRPQFNDYLQEKYAKIATEEARVEMLNCDDAEIVLVAYGISSRIAKTAMDDARKAGLKVGLFRPITLNPFPVKEAKALAARDKMTFISVEMSNGQMADDLRLAIECKKQVKLVNRLGGNLIELNQISDAINAAAK